MNLSSLLTVPYIHSICKSRRTAAGDTQRTKTIADWCTPLHVDTCALIGLFIPKQRWLHFSLCLTLTRPQSSLLRKERSARGDGKEEREREKRLAAWQILSRKVVRGRYCDFFAVVVFIMAYFFHRLVLREVFLRVLGFDPR